ncbi:MULTISPECIES: hypothetical protein [unclassified Synechocystis]|uniref:hypothetical protein n=1 Tax=unclassified Synechocystis TaxID=2640012 RepID=UPI000415AB8F|nr:MULTISPECIES: hypothetical protein [unclassified Synechocystis]AIE74528.1 hypothetical protein D082_20000 [Synechocystis sp. PCC 6714]
MNAKVKQEGRLIAASPVTERMVNGLKEAIASCSPETIIETVAVASLWSDQAQQQIQMGGRIYCPLTIQLPRWLDFPGQIMYQACQDINTRRQWVSEKLNLPLCNDANWLGDHWLPIIVSTDEIGFSPLIYEGMMPNAYEMVSWDLPPYQRYRDVLENLAWALVKELKAPPAVYLLQFSVAQGLVFDRLWPFPAAPAIVTINQGQGNLYTYHWCCLNNLPLPTGGDRQPQQLLSL